MNENIMMEYIYSEPQLLEELLENRQYLCENFVKHFKSHSVKRVYFSGNGSPYNASAVIRYMIEKLLRVEASVEYPSMFNNHCSFNANGVYKPDEMLLICPAQSGRTTGPVYAARKARSLGIPVVCTTLIKSGVLAGECDIIIDKGTGMEKSFPETKGHVATLAILMLCVIETAHELKTITEEEYQHYITSFASLANSCRAVIDATEAWYEKHKDVLLKAKDLVFLGYGTGYPTAVEGGLKILETTLIPCMSYECEEYMHGQNQAVTADSVIFFICPREPEQARMHELLTWCRQHTQHCFLLAHTDDPLADNCSLCCDFTDCEFLSAIEYLIPFQIISHRMARDMGMSTIVAHHDDAGKELHVRFE